MDKGLDIDRIELVAVAHAALNNRLELLSTFLSRSLKSLLAGAPVGSLFSDLARATSQVGLPIERAVGEQVLRWLEAPHTALLVLGEPGYPRLLAEIPRPPPVLFVSGDVGLATEPQVAVVGSRRASSAGRKNAYTFARELAEAGYIVTSGMASGIDAAAHQGALEGSGRTIAVFGCGIDRVYPSHHRDLAAAIAVSGALISEFPLGSSPSKHSFPRRNRIISGLANGTLVVEAAVTSGSLITAMQALEQGREVFAVPGPIRSPLSQGCHALIRQGAILTETVQDILNELGPMLPEPRPMVSKGPVPMPEPLGKRELCVLEACGFSPIGFDDIVESCGLTAPEVSSILTALEMKGWVCAENGSTFVRTA